MEEPISHRGARALPIGRILYLPMVIRLVDPMDSAQSFWAYYLAPSSAVICDSAMRSHSDIQERFAEAADPAAEVGFDGPAA